MSKITLNNLASLQNETSAINTINGNNDILEAAMDNTLSRDGTAPNYMESNLDMNSNKIINLPDATSQQEPVTLSQLYDTIALVNSDIVLDGVDGYVLTANGPNTTPTFEGFTQPLPGAHTRTYDAKFRDYINVKDFGATGNGVDDDTTAIANAISSCPSGQNLYIPHGAYKVKSLTSSIFTINKRIGIVGDGPGTEIILDSTVGTNTDLFTVTPIGASELRGVYFKDFALVNATALTGRTWFVLDSSLPGASVCDIIIDNILAEEPAGNFVQILGGTAGSAFDITIQNCTSYGGGVNLTSAGDNIHIHNNILAGTNAAVFGDQAQGAGNLVISNNNITTFAGSIILRRSINPVIIANVIETVANNSSTNNCLIDIRGDLLKVESPRIIANSIQSLAGFNNPVPIRIDSADSAVIDNNRIFVGSSYDHLVITANAVNTIVTTENSYLTSNSTGGDVSMTNNSASTAVTAKYTGNPTTFGVLYSAGGTGTNTSGTNITTTKKFLAQTGNGSVSAAPVFDTIAGTDLPAINPGILSNITGGSAVPISNGIGTILTNVYGNTNGRTLNTQGGSWTSSSALALGASGTLGSVEMGNATSGTVKIQPVTGALGTSVLSLPAATDTLVGKATTDTLTNKTFNSAGTGNTLQVSGVTVSRGQWPGTATNDSATAGNTGEYVSGTVVTGSAVPMVTTTATNISSISLTAGDWDVWINGYLKIAAGTTVINSCLASISTTSATLDESPGRVGKYANQMTFSGANYMSMPTAGPTRISLSSTTTVYFVGFVDWTTTQPSCFGTIQARRVR